jgi:hypothetical protein
MNEMENQNTQRGAVRIISVVEEEDTMNAPSTAM